MRHIKRRMSLEEVASKNVDLQALVVRAAPQDLVMLFVDDSHPEDAELYYEFAEYLEGMTKAVVAIAPQQLVLGAKNMSLQDLLDLQEDISDLIAERAATQQYGGSALEEEC